MVLKPFFLRGFKTICFHRKTELPGQKSYEKIAFSELCQGSRFVAALRRAPRFVAAWRRVDQLAGTNVVVKA